MGSVLKAEETGDGCDQQPGGTFCTGYADGPDRKRTNPQRSFRQSDSGWLMRPGLVSTVIWTRRQMRDLMPGLVRGQGQESGQQDLILRNAPVRYECRMKGVTGNIPLTEADPVHCRRIISGLAEEG